MRTLQEDSLSGMPTVERPLLAGVNLPHFALQLLGRRDPACLDHPAVVVTEDRPQGIVREVNRLARASRILPGMRYAAALAMAADLRAGVVPADEEKAALADLCARLRRFSPQVEASDEEPGALWLDAAGLHGLWPDLQRWAAEIHQEIRNAGLRSTVVVGWSRFAVYALARYARDVVLLGSRQEEAQRRDRVPLAVLGGTIGLPPATRDALTLLGIQTLGQLLSLREADLRERHGEAAWRLHRRARDQLIEPLRPDLPAVPLQRHRDVEPPDDQRERLLFVIKGLLHDVLRVAASDGRVPVSLHLHLALERPHRQRQRDRGGEREAAPQLELDVVPAEPTLDELQWLDLLRLRLERTQLPARVERLTLRASLVVATANQLRMWQLLAEAGGAGRRDLDAGTQALARLRAALGDDAVVRAEPQSGHLPEARFRWQPAQQLLAAQPVSQLGDMPMVRRLLTKAQALPSRPKHEPDGWLLTDWRQGAVVRLWGPYRLYGGWWAREVRRDYWFVETERGDLLWVFYDHVRRLWYLQGAID